MDRDLRVPHAGHFRLPVELGSIVLRDMDREPAMTGYQRETTTPEVWAVLHASHPNMTVHGSNTQPERGYIFTSYGFAGGYFPVVEAVTTWDVDPEKPHDRRNLVTRYWLCLPCKPDE